MDLDTNVWELILARLRAELDEEEYRRWFLPTAYASDSGDQITIWVPAETFSRYIGLHHRDAIERALLALGRAGTHVRMVAAGFSDDEDDEDDDQ